MSGEQPTVKIYGERNTGTNYLARLLSQNLDLRLLPGVVSRRAGRVAALSDRAAHTLHVDRVRPGERIKDLWFSSAFCSNLGWKHMLVSVDSIERCDLGDRTHFVTLTKNPYSWVLSMFRRPHHFAGEAQTDLEEFVATPWRTVRRERAAMVYPSPVALWNAKNRAYGGLAESFRTTSILYEDLLADPNAVVDLVRDETGARMLAKSYSNVLESTKGDADKDHSFYRKYYLEEVWRDELTPRVLGTINSALDRELAVSLGYEILDPGDL